MDKYTIYALIHPGEESVRYIGMSINVHARYARHLACTGDNPYKDEWIQALRAEQKAPELREIEQVLTIEQARVREQYWIRHYMGRGAKLFNLAITMTPDEMAKVHARRAVIYEQISSLLAQGIYVKRYGYGYAPRLLDPYMRKDDISLFELNDYIFTTAEGKQVSLGYATDQEFDLFIRQYVPVQEYGSDVWPVIERGEAVNFARAHGKEVAVVYSPQPKKARRRKRSSRL